MILGLTLCSRIRCHAGERPARLAVRRVDVGGVHLRVDDSDLSGSDDDEDESEQEAGASEETGGLTEQEKSQGEDLIIRAATLVARRQCKTRPCYISTLR